MCWLHEFLVAPFALLIAAGEPAAIGGVRFDHPELGMVLLDVVVGVHAPLLVRAADEIDAQLWQNVRRIVQRLGEVFNAAPDEDVQRARVVATRTLDDPLRAFGGFPEAGCAQRVERALLADGAQRVGGRVFVGIGLQLRIVALIAVNDRENVRLAARAERRGNQSLDVEHVGIEEQVDHGLKIVGVRAADVGRDKHAEARRDGRCIGLRGGGHRREHGPDENEREDGADVLHAI